MTTQTTALKREIKELKAEIEEEHHDLASLQRKVKNLQAENDGLKAQLEEYNQMKAEREWRLARGMAA